MWSCREQLDCARTVAPSSRCTGKDAGFSPLFPSVTENLEITAKRSFSYEVIKKGGEWVFIGICISVR